jgi:hypothetical protein
MKMAITGNAEHTYLRMNKDMLELNPIELVPVAATFVGPSHQATLVGRAL